MSLALFVASVPVIPLSSLFHRFAKSLGLNTDGGDPFEGMSPEEINSIVETAMKKI